MGTLIEVDSVNTVGTRLVDVDPLATGDGHEGSLVVWVKSRRTYYVLANPSSIPIDDSTGVAVLGIPAARWARANFPIQARVPVSTPTTPANLYIDPVNGNDDGDGSITAPFRTALEPCRRLQHLDQVRNVIFNLLGPMQASDYFFLDFPTFPTNLQADGVTIQGQQVKVAGASGLVVASHQLRNVAADQPQTITVPGFDWTPHLGRILRKSGANVYACIAEDLGGGKVALDDPYDTTANVMASFVDNDVVDVLEMTGLGGGIHARGDVTSLRVRDCMTTSAGILGGPASCVHFAAYLRCVFRGGYQINGTGNLNLTKCSLVGTPTQTAFYDISASGLGTNTMFKDASVTFHNCKGGYTLRQGFLQRATILAFEGVGLGLKGDALWAFKADTGVQQFPQAVLAAFNSEIAFNDSTVLAGGGCTTPNMFAVGARGLIDWFSAGQAPHAIGPAQSLLVGAAVPNTWPQVNSSVFAAMASRI